MGDCKFVTGLYHRQTRRRANLKAVREAFLRIEEALLEDHARLTKALAKP